MWHYHIVSVILDSFRRQKKPLKMLSFVVDSSNFVEAKGEDCGSEDEFMDHHAEGIGVLLLGKLPGWLIRHVIDLLYVARNHLGSTVRKCDSGHVIFIVIAILLGQI